MFDDGHGPHRKKPLAGLGWQSPIDLTASHFIKMESSPGLPPTVETQTKPEDERDR
jgi:hypothetical protein